MLEAPAVKIWNLQAKPTENTRRFLEIINRQSKNIRSFEKKV
jgi:hypothetical protein